MRTSGDNNREEDAATKIQSRVRGKQARNSVTRTGTSSNLPKALSPEQEAALTKIQAGARGLLVRKHVHSGTFSKEDEMKLQKIRTSERVLRASMAEHHEQPVQKNFSRGLSTI